MNSLKSKITAVRKVYETYWESYTKGDLETFASTLDDRFEMIGTSETEVCHSKADGIAFFKAQMHEIVGKTEMRNRQIDLMPVENLMLVNEQCDIYVLTNSDLPVGRQEWNFYSKIRISTWLKETDAGWKVTQQHGSLPDLRVQEGETIALEKISKENLELRDAVKRRTAELENKNRELAIEAALEKVRAVAMSMKNLEDMLDVCRAISDQLQVFGVGKIRNVQIAIIDENIGQYLCYQYFTPYDKTTVEKTDYFKSPVEHGMVKQMLASRDGYFIGGLSGRELEDFRSHRKEENHFPDPFLDKATELDYCFLSIGEGGLGLTLYQSMTEDVLTLFRRFHHVFSLAYQRFQDIQKAEAQAREAQIEVAMERVRARAMAMHHSDEIKDVARELRVQLATLGSGELETCAVNLYEISVDYLESWSALRPPGSKAEILEFHFQLPKKGIAIIEDILKVYHSGLEEFSIISEGAKGIQWMQKMKELVPEMYSAATVTPEFEHTGTFKAWWTGDFFPGGALLMVTLDPPHQESRLLLKRFTKVFGQAYQRFQDLQKAEAHAREVEIDLALERVRAQTMAMHSSEDVGKCVVKMFSELTALGVDEGTRFGIGILNHDNENNLLWTARKNGDEVNMHIGNIDMASHPLLKSARKAWKEQLPFHRYVLEGEDLLNYYQMLNNAPDYKIQIPLEKLPEREIQHCFIFEHGFFYAFSPREFTPELILITKRFSSLFEQTYRRYLDLVKAESQAREAEIELALERVRARTMAMHHTEELKEVIQVVFDQFVGLNIHVEHAGFILDYKEREYMHIWLADLQQGVPTEIIIPFFDSPHWNSYLEAKAKEESFFSNLLPFEVKNKFYQDLFELIPELTEEAKQTIFSKPALAISTVLLDNVGLYIEHYSMTPYTAEENAILMRFGKVFQQTYTRFLDLQKAEAQAKEAQIEAALEKVRSRSLAMHSTNELGEVVAVIVEKLTELGVVLDANGVVLCTYFQDSKDVLHWIASPDFSFAGSYLLPYFDHSIFNDAWQSKENGELYFSKAYSIEDKNSFFEYAFEHSDYRHFPEDFKQWVFQNDKHILSFAWQKNSAILIPSHTGVVPSTDEVAILKRFAKVFEQAYTRFLDLQKAEARAREAKIEAALEKVRSRSLAMHKSDELNEVVAVLFEKLKDLQIPFTAVGIATNIVGSKDLNAFVCGQNEAGLVITNYRLPFFDNPVPKDLYRAIKEQLDYFVGHYSKEEKDSFYEYVIEHTAEFRHLPKDIKRMIFDSTTYTISMVAVKNAVFNINDFEGKVLAENDIDVIKRFARVFDQAYIRFLDLQKAEAQARESQIQLALERVRARTMAMQHSDELMETSELMFEQIKNLGIELWSCGFSLWYDDDSYFLGYNPGPHGKLGNPLKIPLTEDIFFTTIRDAKRRGDDFLVFESEGESLVETYRYMDGLPVVGETMRGFVEAGFPLPTFQVTHCGFFSNGHLMFITKEPNSEAVDIFKRFTKVFNQTYTRFLDLQKAEEQVREAQIEAALERVRSRSLAMHKTSELQSVIHTVHQELLNLNISISGGSFIVINSEIDNEIHCWGSGGTADTSDEVHIPRFDKPFYTHLLERIKNGPGFFTEEYSQDEKIEFFTFLFQHEPWSKLSAKEKNNTLSAPAGYTRSCAVAKHTSIFIINHFGERFSEAENAILIRFGKVFEQSYTRFLDLQKAEAQAREAQIQLSLERIRAKAMSMQHSDELSGFLTVLFEQFNVLNLNPVNCHLNFLDIENNRNIFRITGKRGAALIATQEIDLDASPLWKKRKEDWQAGHPNDVDVLYVPYENHQEINAIFEELLSKLPKEDRPLPEDFPDGLYVIDGYCRYGYLGYSASKPPSDEEKEITRRIAHEFGNVYQRFLDLEKAEAQVREAQIQLSLERIRAKAMAMQHSDEIGDFLTVVFEQFEVLNLNPVFCHLSFFDIDNNLFTYRMTGRTGAAVIATQEIDLEATPLWKQNVEDWKSGHPYQVGGLYIPKERIPEMTEIFNEILEKLPEDERPLLEDFPDGQYVVEGYCKYGYLGYSASGSPSEEEKEITRRIANEFGNVYQRFLDLQKAEAQARESQIQLSLERIRAKAMSMQHSDELSGFLTVLFEQFEVLNLNPVFCHLSLLDIENNRTTFRTTGKKGATLIATQEIDFYASPIWKQKVEDWKLGNPYDVDVMHIPYESLPGMAEIFKEIRSKLPQDDLPQQNDFPDGQYVVEGYCKYGYIGYSASHPPSDEEKEITRRIATEFGNVYQRFIDLQKAEEQTREAQIEAALERVRSRSMAMHKSEELADLSLELVKQVQTLGMESWFCAFNIYDDDPRGSVEWGSNGQGTFPQYRTPRESVFLRYFEAGQRGETLLINEIGEEECTAHYEYLCSLPGVGEQLLQMKAAGIPFPTSQIDHVAFFKYGYVLFITYEPAPESHDIFKRFAKVFEQSYTRFLDLQKAEAQTREAKIEGALEKVRSRNMGMQSSEELPEVANLLFTEVRALGIHAWSCGYNILAEDKTSATCCMSSEGTLQTPFQLRLWGENSFDEMGEFVLSDHTMLVQELGDKALEEHYAYMKSFPDLKPTFDEIDRLGLSLPTYQINHLCKFNGGFILFITYEKVPESHAVFKRFTNVFDQTYTRFLDLKKAEAQARESEIEVAIEKVRSRSLAMHKSDELKDVVFSVFERLRDLQIQTDSTNIVVFHDESAKMEFWAANEMNYSMKFSLPMTGKFYPMEGIEARKEQKTFCQHLPFEEKNKFWKELFDTPDFRKVPEARKNFLLEKTECLIQLVAFGKVTGIMLNRHFNNPFSDAEIEIAERFAKVFDQAYTRFLDLQKAEAQARESQIANALEKVRSRSLAMQSPDELIEVAKLLREEMGALGVEELETSSIYIQEDHSGSTQCWFTIKNPDNPEKAITDQMTLDLQDTWVGRKMDEFFHSKAKHTSIQMQGKERIEWIRYCEKKSDLFGTSNFYGEKIPDRTYHLYKFSNGYIGAAAPGEISAESWDLLKRATAVFSFAYTRFRDLQMAQSSARAALRQASLDRIRANISSMRNADDLGRITPLVFNELTTLGIPFIRCGVFIVHENNSNVEIYLSTPKGKSLAVMSLPFSANEMTSKSVEAWKKGEVYIQHWNQSDFINWGKSMQEQGYVKDLKTYQGAEAAPMSLHLHFVPFAQGLLYVGSTETLSEDQIDLVKALAKSFAIAYARYEDFVKLEQAKAEIESAMNELKSTQSQLVQQEKLASLGQLTAGIAHEIKNPLNFVNNFSEVSIELVDEAIEERSKSKEVRDETLVDEILIDIKSNLQKVHEHGSRANGIVTSMLQHSRGGSGKIEPTDLNALVKEYVNLSFHGMRAGKNPIDVELAFDLDPKTKEVPLIKEDFIRVIINLCNNAFDAMRGKVFQTEDGRQKTEEGDAGNAQYQPKLNVTTSLEKGQIRIAIQDNGPGIPDDIKDKILQPFFTTKKGTEGTGLGLSITHDIIKAHGGSLSIESDANGSVFTITIPTNS